MIEQNPQALRRNSRSDARPGWSGVRSSAQDPDGKLPSWCLVLSGLLSTVDYRHAAVVAILVGLIEVLGTLFLQKRRDDLLTETTRRSERKIDLINAISVYEAVRSRQLTSDGIVRLLRPPEPEHRDPGER